jgi:hypothetical protein
MQCATNALASRCRWPIGPAGKADWKCFQQTGAYSFWILLHCLLAAIRGWYVGWLSDLANIQWTCPGLFEWTFCKV